MNLSDEDNKYLAAYGNAMQDKDNPQIAVGTRVQLKDLIDGQLLPNQFGTVEENNSLLCSGKPYKVLMDDGDYAYCMRAVLAEVVS